MKTILDETTGSTILQIRCPHCHQPIELVNEDPSGDMSCESCGSAFNLAADSETVGDDGSHSRSIAHFTLVKPLGQGAFGSVWEARDTELDRTVAIKFPRKDQLNSTEAEQFLREARAAAQLRHSNIVPVHEVGRDDATLYIVSDFIEGVSLDDWLTGQQLTTREAVELCVAVADALHHAHESGVVHRDLKPANIMLDNCGQPHIMDFGLARREVGEITMTIEGKLLGTPAYMPPEQARGDGHNADRRSDLYSLGVILFELLTGEKPFRGNLRMLLHQVLNEEPPSPRKLNQSVPRDLETITLKCLQKDPDRRYQSTAELATDLGHWLDGKPIAARPIGAMERSWRWCRRKPALAGMWTVATLLLLTLGIGGSLFAFQQADIAARQTKNAITQAELRNKAEDEREKATNARQLAEDKSEEAQVAKERAERNASQAREQTRLAEEAREVATSQTQLALSTLDTVIYQIQNRLNNISGAADVRRELISLALASLKQIADEFSDDAAVDRQTMAAQVAMADTFSRVGLGADFEGKFSPVTAARTLYEQSHTIAQKLADAAPVDAQAQRDLSISFGRLGGASLREGRIQEALTYYQQGLDIVLKQAEGEPTGGQFSSSLPVWYQRLGDISLKTGQLQAALGHYQQAIENAKKLADHAPKDLGLLRNLSIILQGNGEVNLQAGQVNEAVDFYLDAHKILEELIAHEPADKRTQRLLASSYNKLGDVSIRVGKPKDAYVFYKDGLAITLKLAEADTSDAGAQRNIASVCGRLGSVAMRLGHLQEAGRYFGKQLEITRRWASADPNDAEAQRALFVSSDGLGAVSLQAGQLQLALGFYQQAQGIAMKLATLDPTNAQAQRDLSSCYGNLAQVKMRLGQLQEASNLYRQELAIAEKAVEVAPGDSQAKRDLSVIYNNLGDLSRQSGKTLDAQGFYQQGYEITQLLVNTDPTDQLAQQDLSIAYERLGDVNLDSNNVEIAQDFYQRSHKIRLKLVAIDASNAVGQRNFAISCSKLGDLRLRAGQKTNARDLFLKAFEAAEKLAIADPGNAKAQNLLIHSRYKLGQVYSAMFDYSLAGNQYRAGLKALDQMIKTGQDVENTKRDRDLFLLQAQASSWAIIATGDWSELLNHSKAELPLLLSVRCTELAKQGRIEDVAQAADSLMALSADAIESKSDMLYDAACGYGLCALALQDVAGAELTEDDQARRTKYRDLSFNCFKAAVIAGFEDFDYAEQDPDLTALHDFPEFKKLLSDSVSTPVSRGPSPPPLPESVVPTTNAE